MTPYEQLGGEAALSALVARFYRFMDILPEARAIRAMHPPDLAVSEEKLFMFLSGWLGGPSLYIERYGHPFLRKRHLPFAIATPEADAWMLCMRRALADTVADAALRQALEQAFAGMAAHMRNRPDVAGSPA
ncbi:group II truncated hemoglobin [Pseudazoarcus pumilus]|uniref:Globin n=1 Tax=Pseudazoarcus pumilus TaxID=2067960 RepID=A0A2I6S6L1_9RHOO|nr:group II truncated hemoglobin [Pseudazoarcus pumilus]AUN94871.1 globin [Pseudazoarcus pumilus]